MCARQRVNSMCVLVYVCVVCVCADRINGEGVGVTCDGKRFKRCLSQIKKQSKKRYNSKLYSMEYTYVCMYTNTKWVVKQFLLYIYIFFFIYL